MGIPELEEIDSWNKQSLVRFIKWFRESKKEQFFNLIKEYDIQRRENETRK